MNARLFNEQPSYAAAKLPAPRPFQESAHQALRQGFAEGHRCQIVCAPTGAGKTILALRVAHEALLRGRRVVFLADRTTLINQTSAAADAVGLVEHGIVQAQHWRRDPHLPFQIASAQTIAKRGYWPKLDVLIVDEAHTQHGVWLDFAKTTDAAVIGLSATPFSKGLGQVFSRLVNATTMAELTRTGVLVPMRVLSCTRPDMAGAAVSKSGEWTDKAAEERGMEIIGDVVGEWLKFGENRKTIVFGATIAHCKEMARQFVDAGVMAAVFTSETTASEREALVSEFSKPDPSLRVLISVEALAKGFDVPDVGCVVDCRPLRKSLSTAIQMWGRGLRSSPATGKTDCIARDTLVLTDKGEVRIQDITLDHKVWDGQNFVSHAGAICRGVQKVIEYDGLIATPDHEVMTNDGWKRFEEAASGQLRIARTGFGGQPVRFADHSFKSDTGRKLQPTCGSAVCKMRGAALRTLSQHPQAPGDCGVPALQWKKACSGAGVVVSAMPSADATLQQPESSSVRALRSTWDRVSLCISERSGALGGLASWGTRGSRDAIGQGGQQRPLRAGESSLDEGRGKHEQHARLGGQDAVHGLSQKLSACEVCGCHSVSDDQSGPDGRANKRALADAIPQTEREVWDVLNAGPLQRFTANGRLVHNCILLDHSGNILRFAEDFEQVFHNGVDSLDMGEKLDRTVRKDDKSEFEAKGCPSCGHAPFRKRCMACGYEKPAPATEAAEAGVMLEIAIGTGKNRKVFGETPAHLWGQVCSYARRYSAPEKQQKRAWHLYRNIAGNKPPPSWHINTTPEIPLTKLVADKIKALNIAFAKGRAT